VYILITPTLSKLSTLTARVTRRRFVHIIFKLALSIEEAFITHAGSFPAHGRGGARCVGVLECGNRTHVAMNDNRSASIPIWENMCIKTRPGGPRKPDC